MVSSSKGDPSQSTFRISNPPLVIPGPQTNNPLP